MKNGNIIAPHEALELHELLTFKNVCATKSATMSGLVKDEELKSILQQDFSMSKEHIKEFIFRGIRFLFFMEYVHYIF